MKKNITYIFFPPDIIPKLYQKYYHWMQPCRYRANLSTATYAEFQVKSKICLPIKDYDSNKIVTQPYWIMKYSVYEAPCLRLLQQEPECRKKNKHAHPAALGAQLLSAEVSRSSPLCCATAARLPPLYRARNTVSQQKWDFFSPYLL